MKLTTAIFGLMLAFLSGATVSQSHAAVTIATVQNSSTGGFLTSTGLSLTSGEISVGFFSSAPTQAQWDALEAGSAGDAWAAVLGLGYKDIRSIAGAQLATGFDWSYSPTSTIGGTIQNLPIASVPQNTRLYVLGFNAGTWNNTTKTATFNLATEWAAVSAFGHTTATQNFFSPADLGTKSITFKAAVLTANDVLVGDLLSSANGTVTMIPEPSVASLLLASSIVLLRRRSKASK